MKLKKIGLVVKPDLINAYPQIQIICTWATKNKQVVVIDQLTKKLLDSIKSNLDLSDLAIEMTEELSYLHKNCQLIITLGGDGTLIGVARLADESSQAIMMGVNFGTLGYLTEINSLEIEQILPLILEDKAPVEKRSLLQCLVNKDKNAESGSKNFKEVALNDVVIHKGISQKLLSLEVFVNDHPLINLRADGLIIATPTGSTAYSLAAGGSVVYPSLNVTLVTPICPHSLTIRPLILPAEQQITVKTTSSTQDVYVTVDGQVTQTLNPEEIVSISKANFFVSLIGSPNRNYFDILKSKINWGKPNRVD